jgi:hypothetical protein
MLKQASRLIPTFVFVALSGCATPHAPVETADVVALRQRAKACRWFQDMVQNVDDATKTEAVLRLRGMDEYRCEHLQREAVHLMRDPAENPSGDQRTEVVPEIWTG